MPSELKYKKGIVTFLDLLGWRDLLAKKDPGELARILQIFRSEGDPKPKLLKKIGERVVTSDEDDAAWASMYEYAALSDCAFRCTDIEYKINEKVQDGHLFHELISLNFIQARLAQEGYLIRGAVTFGEYHGSRDSHGSALFGPAIARAYEIETKLANYPRIVIDPTLIEEYFRSKTLKARGHTHMYEWSEYLREFLRREENGVWFLDYLWGYINAVGENDTVMEFFNAHKVLVESKLAELLKKDRIYPDSITEKVLWLLRYHNSTMLRLNWQSLPDYRKEDFLVAVPDHPVFKEYELIREADIYIPPGLGGGNRVESL